MITIYATIDELGNMSSELFPTTGILERNKEKFEVRTRGNVFIATEDVFSELLKNAPPSDHLLILISERLFKEHQQPNESYAEHDGMLIFPGYQTALPFARQGRREVTLLGGPNLLQEAVRKLTVDRLYLVTVQTKMPGGIQFPEPIIDYFDFVDEEPLPHNRQNKFPAMFRVYYKK